MHERVRHGLECALRQCNRLLNRRLEPRVDGWLRVVDDGEHVVLGCHDIRFDLEPTSVRLLTIRPRHQCCRQISTGHVREGITAANAGIQIEDITTFFGDHYVAVKNAEDVGVADLVGAASLLLSNEARASLTARVRAGSS